MSWRLTGGGLTAVGTEGGALTSLAHADAGVELVQHAASALEPGLLQIWVRDRADDRCWPVLGAGSGGVAGVADGALVVTGGEPAGAGDDGLRWRATLRLHPDRPAWSWLVEVSAGTRTREVDVVHAHDLALAGPGALRANELYISQYLDLTPLDGPTGTALAVRQNLPQGGGRHPWAVLAADRQVTAWATDALDVHGWSARQGGPRGPRGDLPARRRQHEHTLATLQVAPARLDAGRSLVVTFAGLLVEDHPGATGAADVERVVEALELAREAAEGAGGRGRPAEPDADAGSTVDATPDGVGTAQAARPTPSGAYDAGREVATRALTEDELHARWPGPWRVVERDDDGRLLSFFAGDEHVVTAAKEVAVLRPHGTILRTGSAAVPDPAGLTVTAWMTGSPLSYLTRGHATTGRVLSTVRGYLGLHRAYGLRLFVEVAGRWRLLDLPSAFSMTPDSAHWVHALDPAAHPDLGGPVTVEVRTHVPAHAHRAGLRVSVDGAPRRFLVALHLATADDPLPPSEPVEAEAALDGVVVHVTGPGGATSTLDVRASTPVTVGDDAPLQDDGEHHAEGVVTLVTEAVPGLELDLGVGHRDDAPRATGTSATAAPVPPASATEASDPAAGTWWRDVTSIRVDGDATPAAGDEVDALTVSLPWLVRDALVHHLSPRGLEQYTGGAWGTRDVTQGPLELLLALDRIDDARHLLLTVFAAQSTDGSWPQAFGFLPGDEHFRHEPPHGDVVHWPVLALGRYLLASADASVLDEPVPWYTPGGTGTPSSLRDHVDRALSHARAGALPGTHLVAYGHGDWNDSLQPADPAMATTMVSAWTVTLHHQALTTLADGMVAAGEPVHQDAAAGAVGQGTRVAALRAEAALVAADLRCYLLVDDELAGYAQLGAPEEGRVPVLRHLVHPRDTATGLQHGALQVIHALGDDLLDPAQARHHVELVRSHLTGVDGVRLFDRPPGYHGGEMHHFQRAETATFVGREIGLMYVHAHLRWCEAMARWGDPEALWLGVRQVLAPAVGDVVPGARRRQANTYASSSDAAVADRDDFATRYAEVLAGTTGLEGGWRIYSSGPGVLVRVLTHSLLGIRRRGAQVEIDPVLPPVLDGLGATVPLAGGLLRVRYRVRTRGYGVEGLRLDGRELVGERTENPYRIGGLRLDLADLADALRADGPELEVRVP